MGSIDEEAERAQLDRQALVDVIATAFPAILAQYSPYKIADRIIAHLNTANESAEARPIWRHKKRGTTYRVLLDNAPMQEEQTEGRRLDDEPMVVYQDLTSGNVYVRPVVEFYDGRFEALSAGGDEAKKSEGGKPNDNFPGGPKATDLCIDCDGAGKYPSGADCISCGGIGRVFEGDGVPSDPPAPRREIAGADEAVKPFGFYFWKSNGDGTESPDFCEGPIPSYKVNVRNVTPLYTRPAKAVDVEAAAKIIYYARPFPDMGGPLNWDHLKSEIKDEYRAHAKKIAALRDSNASSDNEGGR